MKKYFALFLCVMLMLSLAACSTLELDANTLDLKLGETGQITPDTKDTPVTYQSSDTSVATVDENGTITTVGIGTATITATNSKNKTAECVVTVTHVEPSEISLKETAYIIEPENTAEIDITFEPANTTNFAVSYVSSNETVATVDQNGTITGISSGSATITVTTENGKIATCEVTVPPYVESITMDTTLDLVVKGNSTLSVTYTPENCIAEKIIWTSSDESVATVNNGKVTAIGPGTASITAQTETSGCIAECTVTVDYAELTATINSGGYSSSSMVSVNGHAVFTKSIGFKPKATASGGSGDYEYKIDIIKNGSTIYTTGWQKSSNASHDVSSGGTYTVKVTVRDSRGVTATASETITLS